MGKFFAWMFAAAIVIGSCTNALESVDDPTSTTTTTTVAVTTTTIGFADPVAPVPVEGSGTGKSGSSSRSNSGSSSYDEVDCDNAEDLYDQGYDYSDYCDYGPDGEWDTEDDYDGWEE